MRLIKVKRPFLPAPIAYLYPCEKVYPASSLPADAALRNRTGRFPVSLAAAELYARGKKSPVQHRRTFPGNDHEITGSQTETQLAGGRQRPERYRTGNNEQ